MLFNYEHMHPKDAGGTDAHEVNIKPLVECGLLAMLTMWTLKTLVECGLLKMEMNLIQLKLAGK